MNISNLTQTVINSGVTPQLKIEEAQIVRLTNLFGMIPMVFFVIYMINGLVYDIDFFWQIGLINMVFNIIAIVCNYKGFYAMSKTVLLAANSIILFLLVNIVEGNSSAVAFFFPVLSCYVVFYDIIRELRTVLINLAVTSVCILLCLTLPDHTLGHVSLPSYMSGNITRMNYLLAFIAFTCYVFTIIKVKLQSETLLIQSIQTAEIMANKSDQLVNQLTVQKEKAEQATKTKSFFLAEVSEEIRKPVQGIIESTNSIAGKEKSKEIQNELGELSTSTLRILNTINDVDELYKIEQGKIRAERNIFRLHGVFGRLKEKISGAPPETVELAFDIQADAEKDIISDENKLFQALQILIDNSITSYHATRIRLKVITEAARKDSMTLGFSITWDGQSRKKRLDDAGGKNLQSGFRMALCEKLVEMIGGRLTINESADNQTLAEFKLPVKLVSSAAR